MTEKEDYQNYANGVAFEYQIPPELFASLITQESNWKPNVVSSAGAIGIAQFMPKTAESMGVNPEDPYSSLDGAGKYLSDLYRRFGTWEKAIAAYNSGPSAVAEANGIPDYPETQNYVKSIFGRLKHPIALEASSASTASKSLTPVAIYSGGLIVLLFGVYLLTGKRL